MHGEVSFCLFIEAKSSLKLTDKKQPGIDRSNCNTINYHSHYVTLKDPGIFLKTLSIKSRAYEDYKTVFAKGEDGRPHWVARKTCNYVTEAIDVGFNL